MFALLFHFFVLYHFQPFSSNFYSLLLERLARSAAPNRMEGKRIFIKCIYNVRRRRLVEDINRGMLVHIAGKMKEKIPGYRKLTKTNPLGAYRSHTASMRDAPDGRNGACALGNEKWAFSTKSNRRKRRD